MKNKILLIGAVVLLAPTMSARAADIFGNWIARVPGTLGSVETVSGLRTDGKKLTGWPLHFVEITFYFRAEGKKLTGTVATPQGKTAISEGRIDGDDISFVVMGGFIGNETKLLYRGTVVGDEIKFTREVQGGMEQPQRFTARREFQRNQDVPLQKPMVKPMEERMIIIPAPED